MQVAPKASKRGKSNPGAIAEASDIAVRCSHDAIVPVSDLVPNPRNPNKHGTSQIDMLAKVIRHQGWRSPIVVSKRSGFIVVGHGRLEAAKLLQVETVPVNYQEFATEADEWAHLIADNRIAELADLDKQVLSDVLLELDTGAFDMEQTGFDATSLEKLMTATPDLSEKLTGHYEVAIECGTESEQKTIYERMTKEGHKCRLLTL